VRLVKRGVPWRLVIEVWHGELAPSPGWLIVLVRQFTIMPGRSYLIFGDIEGKLDVLCVECTKCARKGRYSVRRLIEKYGAQGKHDYGRNN